MESFAEVNFDFLGVQPSDVEAVSLFPDNFRFLDESTGVGDILKFQDYAQLISYREQEVTSSLRWT